MISCTEFIPAYSELFNFLDENYGRKEVDCFWEYLFTPDGAGIPLINYLKKWKSDGNKLILWTCRIGEALSNAVAWCQEHGLEFDAVNDNLPEIIEYYGSNSRKVTCDWYIDDRNLLFDKMEA